MNPAGVAVKDIWEAEVPADILDRFVVLEQRLRRATRWLIVLGGVILLQTLAITHLVVPFGGPAKHPVTLQAGTFEVVDPSGTVRAGLAAEPEQTGFSMSDARGGTRVLLRENDAGFVTLEVFDHNSNRKVMTLFSGTRRSVLELRDPKSGRHVEVQAAEEGMGLTQFDDRGQPVP